MSIIICVAIIDLSNSLHCFVLRSNERILKQKMVPPRSETLSPNPSDSSFNIGNIPILKSAVHATIADFLHNRLSNHGDIAADVYRTLRDEAGLLFERQLIFDSLDSDPFELTKMAPNEHAEKGGIDDEVDEEVFLDKKRNAEVIARVKVSTPILQV